MKIALIGYGRMGKRIAELAIEKGHEVAAKIDSSNKESIHSLPSCDVAIEFTQPDAAISNFETLLEQNIPTVTGTTGWYVEMDKVKALCNKHSGKFFYASNFSPGVFITHHLTARLAEIMNAFDYRAEIKEWHHTGKKDAPSGTAETLAQEIVRNNQRYSTYGLDSGEEDSVRIEAERKGDIKGIHSVKFSSEIDSIEIRHEAFSRDGFALGAIMAAEFLIEKNPGFYTMNNLIQL